MKTNLAQLRWKEVIDIQTGNRFGFVEDLELNLETGQVNSLVIPGKRRLFGLLGREEPRYIVWESIQRFGDDVILVSQEPRSRSLPKRRQKA